MQVGQCAFLMKSLKTFASCTSSRLGMGLSHFREGAVTAGSVGCTASASSWELVWKKGLSTDLSFSTVSSSASVRPVDRGICLHPLGQTGLCHPHALPTLTHLHGPVVALVPATPVSDLASGPAEGAEQRSRMPWERGCHSAAGGRGCPEWPALSQSQALGPWQGGCATPLEVWAF